MSLENLWNEEADLKDRNYDYPNDLEKGSLTDKN